MASINKVTLIGNAGRDPESRTFPSGDQVTNVTIATTETWKDKSTGEKKDATEWHRLVFNGRLAEIAAQYIKKGSSIYVEGKIKTRKWTDQATGQERYATEIQVHELKLLGGRPEGAGAGAAPQQQRAAAPAQQPAPAARANGGFDDDDIPF